MCIRDRSDTLQLDTRHVVGLVTSVGGPTSHTAILARTLGLPAIVAAGPALLTVPDGGIAVVDGGAGCLYLDLSEADQPVSYTHLDVYKRQPSWAMAWPFRTG